MSFKNPLFQFASKVWHLQIFLPYSRFSVTHYWFYSQICYCASKLEKSIPIFFHSQWLYKPFPCLRYFFSNITLFYETISKKKSQYFHYLFYSLWIYSQLGIATLWAPDSCWYPSQIDQEQIIANLQLRLMCILLLTDNLLYGCSSASLVLCFSPEIF